MKILSDDYSPFGTFSYQILGLTLGFVLGGIILIGVGILVGFPLIPLMGITFGCIIFGCIVFHWGMKKQDRKLFGK